MLILPNSCFLHVPKTGGSWVKKAIIASGIDCKDYRIDGNPHIGLSKCPAPEKFKFAFVRHPVHLYRSYWQYKMTYGWDKKNILDMECKSDNFNTFIRNVLEKYPGCYGDALIEFVGEGEHEIEFIGKYENLIEDLITALKSAKESFNEDIIRNLPPCNVSDKKRFPAQYTEELEQEVRKSEVKVMNRFGYK
ncbi:MAG: hypothetical protein D6819_05170 [Gammaproteobacteria bacterium]|nr:MAG: hypothetical protein D6819_05170 [Gammaproteobacteria bacterium]